MKKYYTLREISQILDIPKSTIVKYKDHFGAFMRIVGDGKRKKFHEDSIETIRIIRELREDRNLDWLDIKDILQKRIEEGIVSTDTDTLVLQPVERPKTATPKAAPDITPPPLNTPALKNITPKPSVPSRHSAPATVPQAQHPAPVSSPSVSPAQYEHLSHLVTALAGELVQVSSALRDMRDVIRRQDQTIKSLSSSVAATHNNVQSIILGIIEKWESGEIATRDLTSTIKSEISSVNSKINALNTSVRQLRDAATDDTAPSWASDMTEALNSLTAALDENRKLQDQNVWLTRENDILKQKILDHYKSSNRNVAPAPAPTNPATPSRSWLPFGKKRGG